MLDELTNRYQELIGVLRWSIELGRYLDWWEYFYPNDKEMMPRHMPEALVMYVVIKYYLDDNHAGNTENRRSYSGIIIYANNAPIIWYSKQHNTVEASSFESYFLLLGFLQR